MILGEWGPSMILQQKPLGADMYLRGCDAGILFAQTHVEGNKQTSSPIESSNTIHELVATNTALE